MSSFSEAERERALDRRVASVLPERKRDRWLQRFADLYRELVDAARSNDLASSRWRFRLLSTTWRIKFAIMRHLLRVHRFKASNEEAPAVVEPPPAVVAPPPAVVESHKEAERTERLLLPWMIEDFKRFAGNEPTLWPDGEFVSRFSSYKPYFNRAPGQLYFHLYSLLADAKIETVVLCPWLKRGGGDKGALQFVEYYAKRGGVALITTLDADSPWLEKAYKGVQTIEFGKLARDLSEDERIAILTRLLLELAPRIVHNMNSDLVWRCFSRHGKALRSNGAKLVVSLFGDEVDPSGRHFGYAITYMPQVRNFIDLAIFDNAPYRDTIRRRYRLPEHRVRRVPFWHETAPFTREHASTVSPAERASVLWAGRLTESKRLDILFAVAQACRDVEFHVFGESDAGASVAMWRNQLAELPNVRLHGAYDSFHSIAERRSYRAFLYTTAFDGLPNVLLEAACHWLPIVAPPEIGGLADMIGPETAFPVDDGADAHSYVDALCRCLADPTEAMRRAQNAFELVRDGHSRETFNAAMDAALAGFG